eukprot:7679230-Alexandrium_andersonii.AAC.1
MHNRAESCRLAEGRLHEARSPSPCQVCHAATPSPRPPGVLGGMRGEGGRFPPAQEISDNGFSHAKS